MPAMPCALSVISAPAVLATWVPCQELASGGLFSLVQADNHGSVVVQSPRSQPPGTRSSVARPETKASVMKS